LETVRPLDAKSEEILEARMKKIEAGEATFYTLEEVRHKLDELKNERRQAGTRTSPPDWTA